MSSVDITQRVLKVKEQGGPIWCEISSWCLSFPVRLGVFSHRTMEADA